MPECPEITMLSQYLSILKDKYIEDIDIIKGKYTRKEIKGLDKFDFNDKLIIKKVDSKGKLLFFKLKNMRSGDDVYMTSHLGLSGEWTLESTDNDYIRITIGNTKNDKKIYMCYYDPRNFGNIEFMNEKELEKKLNELADDVLKTKFTEDDFIKRIEKYMKVSAARKKQKIFLVLMKQNKKDGLFSGLGNYLTPEILYDCKISPYRTMESLSDSDLKSLAKSIKKIVKLSYYNNITGYMTNFGDFTKIHKKGVDENKFPNYHDDVKIKNNEKFDFRVYQKDTDPLGNKVEKDKILNKGRTVYYVPKVQI
jgi:formamidopyrimidine-DNA glycosylase